jgi:hypothetical protein
MFYYSKLGREMILGGRFTVPPAEEEEREEKRGDKIIIMITDYTVAK